MSHPCCHASPFPDRRVQNSHEKGHFWEVISALRMPTLARGQYSQPYSQGQRRCGLWLPVQQQLVIGNESVPIIIINNTINLLFKTAISILLLFQTITVSECCLIKLPQYILFEKCIYILALEMASSGNRHCANCIGTLSFRISASQRAVVVLCGREGNRGSGVSRVVRHRFHGSVAGGRRFRLFTITLLFTQYCKQ